MISVAAMLDQDNGMFWKGWFKYADLNRDEGGFNTIAVYGRKISSLGVSMETSVAKNFRVKVGGFLSSDRVNRLSNDDDRETDGGSAEKSSVPLP